MRGKRKSCEAFLDFYPERSVGVFGFLNALQSFDLILFSLIFGAIESKVDISTTPSGIPCLTL